MGTRCNFCALHLLKILSQVLRIISFLRWQERAQYMTKEEFAHLPVILGLRSLAL